MLPSASKNQVRVRIVNSGKNIAFFLHAQATKPGTDQEIAPVLWSDNFVSLLPGESRELTATVTGAQAAKIKVDGWNVAEQMATKPNVSVRPAAQ